MPTRPEKHEVSPENASLFWDWLQNRGGLSLWRSINLSNPGETWTGPALEKDGSPKRKENWQMENFPHRIITDPAEVVVVTRKEVERFRVAVRRGAQGLMDKLTDHSSAKLNRRLDHWTERNPDAARHFDYGTQEAVITVPDGRKVPLQEWMELR
jgi:hypothetical protein